MAKKPDNDNNCKKPNDSGIMHITPEGYAKYRTTKNGRRIWTPEETAQRKCLYPPEPEL